MAEIIEEKPTKELEELEEPLKVEEPTPMEIPAGSKIRSSNIEWDKKVDHGNTDGLSDDDHTQYVEMTGDETIAGIKTFSSIPRLPASNPVIDNEAVRKKYVDDSVVVNKIEVVYTDVTITNTTTETNLVRVSIPGGTLGTNNAVRVRIFIDYLVKVTIGTDTLRFKYGNTTVVTVSEALAAVDDRTGFIDILLVASGATNAQEGSMAVNISAQGDATNHSVWFEVNDSSGVTEDSTGDLNLTITWQWGNANAGNIIRMRHAIVEKITQ